MIDRSSVIYTSIFDYRKPQRSIIETWQTITTVRQHHQSKLSARQRLRTGSCQLLLAVKLSHVRNRVHALSDGFPKKMHSCGHCPKEWGGEALPNF